MKSVPTPPRSTRHGAARSPRVVRRRPSTDSKAARGEQPARKRRKSKQEHDRPEIGNRVALALDLATSTGWAVGAAGSEIVSGVASFKPRTFEGGGMRYLRFISWLDRRLERNPFEIVFYEEVRRHIGATAAHVYGGLMGALTAWCEQHKIPYAGVPVGAWKKAVVGSGSAKKHEVQARVVELLGLDDAPPEDEADALSILLYVTRSAPKIAPRPKPPPKKRARKKAAKTSD